MILSCYNYRFFNQTINIVCEFIPQVLFLSCTFLYLVVEIFYKWFVWAAREPQLATGSSCAPNLLIGKYLFHLSFKPIYHCLM